MNAIAIQVELSSLDLLVPLGNNNYDIAIQFFKVGLPDYLDLAGVPNQYIARVNTISPIFTVYVPVTEGSYNFSTRVRTMPNNTDSVCYQEKTVTINQA